MNTFFKGVYGSPRTKIEIIKSLLIETYYSPTSLLFVGDAMTDYTAAKETNIPFVGRMTPGITFPVNTKTVNNLKDLQDLVIYEGVKLYRP